MDKKIDRRINRTRRALRAALLALILEKGFDAVTIEEITQRADVGRTTFYLHYRDKEDILLESVNELVDDLIHQLSQIPLSEWKLDQDPLDGSFSPSSPIILTFQHVASHADLYRVIYRGQGTFSASQQLREIIANAVESFLRVKTEKENLEIHPMVPMDVFVNYLAGSMQGLLTWWLEENMPYPPERMALMFQILFIRGARTALGLQLP